MTLQCGLQTRTQIISSNLVKCWTFAVSGSYIQSCLSIHASFANVNEHEFLVCEINIAYVLESATINVCVHMTGLQA